MMKQEKHVQTVLGFTVGFIVILVSISGCTSNQNTKETISQLSGTWVGNVEIPMSGGRGNTSISQITFESNIAELTLGSTQGSFTMNYTFTENGNTLVLEPNFSDRGGFPGQQPYNGTRPGNWTRPPMNETMPINGTRPYNGTQPGNWTRPENGTGNPGGGRPSMSISFTYSVNGDHTVLYLNGAEFRKI
jgi:hypothetical protein